MAQELQIRGRDAALQCDRVMDQLLTDAEVSGEIRTAFLVAFEIGEPMFFFKEKKKARIMEALLAIELALFSAACGEKLRTLKDSGEISEDEFDVARKVLEERVGARAGQYASLSGYLAAIRCSWQSSARLSRWAGFSRFLPMGRKRRQSILLKALPTGFFASESSLRQILLYPRQILKAESHPAWVSLDEREFLLRPGVLQIHFEAAYELLRRVLIPLDFS